LINADVTGLGIEQHFYSWSGLPGSFVRRA